MAKSIILNHNDRQYTLEFNRNTVEKMQRDGFVMDTDRLYMSAKDLIAGAFRMHHRHLQWSEIEEIWKAQSHKDQLLAELAKMFSQPVIDLMGVDEEDKEENPPTWQVSE